ncbi:MAG: hypothetical protein OXC15_14405, partial [Rhodospirillaceae bacterium]|nr:hypothetical protein [Rhodospirillaceae bacterium]
NAARYLGLYDTERIELRAGDLIRWTRNRKAPPGRGRHPRGPDLVNGGEAEILEIGYRRVLFREGGREFGLSLTDPQLRHLDHAYCSTVHAAQGRTARAAIAVLDAGGVADRELFHVELSRASEEFLLLTDDRDALIESMAYDRGEDGALEALGIDLSEPPAVDPEVFAALAADWRALLREGEAANTLPFFLPGYRDVMAQAAALAQIEDLPEDMRRLTDTMLAKHEEHLAHDREVQGLVEGVRDHWRRWPELGWAASSQGVPVETLREHAAWREEGATLLEAAARLGAEGEAAHLDVAHREVAHHLHAMQGGHAGLEDAVGMLERTRLLDDAGRFERAWHALRERAAESVVPEIYAPGYRQVAALGERLAAAEGLDAQAQRKVAEWREIDTAQTALADEARALPGRIAAWQSADLPQDEPGGLDPDHPARQSWREEGVKLEAMAGDMLRPQDAHGPHLDAVPGGRESIRQAAEEVADALRHDGYRAFGWLTKEVNRQARETGTEAFHVPRYGDLTAQAEALSAQAALPARTQEVVASWLDYHARCEPLCRQIRDWPMRVDALTADCPERPATLDALNEWRQRAEPLLDEARAMFAEDGPHAPHLAALPAERGALTEGTGRLDRALIAVEAREIDVLSSVVQQWAKETGGIGFDSRGYAALMERARSLDARPHLPQGLRGAVDGLLARDERWTLDRNRVEAFLVRAAEAERARNALTQMDVTTNSFEERRQARQDCRQKEKEVLDEAAALGKDVPKHELAAHLGAAGAGPDAVQKREEEIRNRIAQEQEKQAALRMSRDRGMSM